MNVKKTLVASIISLSALAGPSVFAAESANLTVKGAIIVGSCTPTLSDSGIVDLGTLAVEQLPHNNADSQAFKKRLDLTIHCDSPTKVGFSTVDNRADSLMDTSAITDISTHDNFYGMGKTANGVSIGGYQITFDDTDAPSADDDADVVYIASADNTTWNTTTSVSPSSVSGNVYSLSAKSDESTGYVPVAMINGTYHLEVSPVFQASDALNITDDTAIDGSATINIVYL